MYPRGGVQLWFLKYWSIFTASAGIVIPAVAAFCRNPFLAVDPAVEGAFADAEDPLANGAAAVPTVINTPPN
ncbi:hypothetical protein, partial [Fischerella thermalis]|uniref:hypothetical protein n=1 Tax=Fischerella thermalis TaxID=372787 RepID=UPI0015E06023